MSLHQFLSKFEVKVSQYLPKTYIISSHKPLRTFRSKLNVGTLNIRGLNTDLKEQHVANDMRKYQLTHGHTKTPTQNRRIHRHNHHRPPRKI